jgi:hypothetical protein
MFTEWIMSVSTNEELLPVIVSGACASQSGVQVCRCRQRTSCIHRITRPLLNEFSRGPRDKSTAS